MSKTRTFLSEEQVKTLTFAQVREALDEKRKALAQIFQGRDVHEIPAEDAVDVKAMNDELTFLAGRYDELSQLNDIKGIQANLTRWLREPVNQLPNPQTPMVQAFKDAGRMFLESEQYKAARVGDYGKVLELPITTLYPEFGNLDFDGSGVKSLLGTAVGGAVATAYAVENMRLPGIIGPVGETPLRVEGLFPAAGMVGNSIPYMVETSHTPAAAETAEGATKPEAALGFTESESAARVVAAWIPVTRQLLSDEPALRGYINGRLRYFVDARVDSQLLNGNGVAPNLAGILNTASIQTQAKGADPTPDAVYKAMTKVAANSAGYYIEPDASVFHPNDWQDIRLLRTTDGIYIWGSPAEPGPDRIWGLRVVKTTAISENTGLVGSFRMGAMIFNRWEFGIRVAEQHSSDFTANIVTILGERRLAFPVFRPAAFCTVTGI